MWRFGYLFLFVQLFILSHAAIAGSLTLTLPQATSEGAGTISGTVAIDAVAQTDIEIHLVSDNPAEIASTIVLIPSGDSSASFELPVEDDRLVDGVQAVVMTASADGWEESRASIFVADNETKRLFLDLPEEVFEGQGTLTNSAMVYLDGVAVTDFHVLLQSADTTEVEVPIAVTISAGQSNAVFYITAVDDADVDGRQYPTIHASLPGFIPAAESMGIGDNEFAGFSVSGPEGDMPGNVPLLVSVEAVNIDGEPIAGYSGSAQFSARLSNGTAVSVSPSSAINMVNGRWQGAVTVNRAEGNNIRLQVSDNQGHTGNTAYFNLFELRVKNMVTDWKLPYIYMLHRDPDPAYPLYWDKPGARLLWFNSDFGAVERVVTPGDYSLDIAVHYGENRIYLSRQSEAVVYDRTSQEALDPLPVSSTATQVNAGRAGRLVTVRGRYADLWDTETGMRVATRYLSLVGGGKCSPDGRYFYYAQDGSTGSKLTKYDFTGDTFLSEIIVDTPNFGSENLVLSGDGTRAFNVGAVYRTSDLQKIAGHSYYDDEVYAASFHGGYAVTKTELIDSISGEALISLPVRSEQSAFYPDQSRLLVFDPYTAELHMVRLDTLGGGLPGPGMLPNPEVGSLCMTSLPELSWTPVPYGTAYDVYLGTDSNAVANATTNSAEYLGRDAVPEHALAEGTLAGSEAYYWRVDIITYGDEREKGAVWNFRTASILVDPADLFAEGIGAAYTEPVSIPVDRTVATPAAWSVSCSSAWLVLNATNGIAPDSLDLAVDFATLASGDHTAELVFNDGSGTFTVPFTVSVEQLRVVRMATDYEMPYIYMLHTSGSASSASTLFWFNTGTGEFDHVLGVGTNATDLTIHYADDRIYVANGGRGETRVFDRTTKTELDPLLLGNDDYTVSAGAAGRLVAEGYAQYGGSVNAHVLNSSNGTSLATTSFSNGDGECSPDGRFYYHSQSKLITKYDIGQDTFAVVTNKAIPYSWDVVVSRNGARVSTSRSVFDADLNELFYLDDAIHALSAYGELIVTYKKLFNGGTGEEIQYLPFNTRVMAFSGDQSQLVLFNSSSGSLTSLVTSAIMPIPNAAMEPVPAVGSVHGANLPSLSWTGSPSAVGYDVYLGTDPDTVATNGPGGAEYLGRFTETELALLEGTLAGNRTYYWRVDMVGFGNTIVPGSVWSFDTSSIAVEPYRIEVSAVAAAYTQRVSVAVDNMVGAPIAWTVGCTNDWVQLGAPGGTGSATLDLDLDLSGLAPGTYSAELVFDDGGHQLFVPIELSVEAMRLVKMETDWTLPYVYMVHASPTYPYPSLLVWYNTDTDTIEQALDVGDGTTDLAVHYGENRIYVNNSVHSEIRVFDRSSKEELEPLPSNASLKSLATGRPGTLLTAGNDAYLTDTETGTTLDSYSSYNGRGDSTLDGRTYYHSENGYSGASVIKFAVDPGSSDPLDYINQVRTKDYYGSDQILVGMDGRRLYTGGAIYDADLNELFDLNDTIYAASAFGDLVVSATKAYDGATGSEVYSLPLSANVMAFAADQSKLLLFDEGNASITNIDTTTIMLLPEPDMIPDPASGSVQRPTLEQLSWSMAPGALEYDVYLGTDSNAVSVAGTNALEYLGRFDLPTLALTNGQLSGSQSYAWRVDAVRFGDEVARGDVWKFRTTSFAVVPNELSVAGMAAAYTQTVSLAVDSMVVGTVDWTVSCTNDWIVLAETNGIASGTLDVGLDMGRLALGIHTANLIFSDGSDSLTVPVTVDVEALRVVKMVTDYSKPYLYMLHTSAESPYQSRLIWYNTNTDSIEQVRDAGMEADDLTVHYWDDRIYVNTAQEAEVRVFARSTKAAMAPLVLTNSENGISAGGTGQMIVEATASRIGLRSTVDGRELAYASHADEGFGECTLDGRIYYHAESDGSSSSDLFKFSIESNTISYVSRTTTKGLGWGDYGVVVSMDGQRIYTHHLIFDADMNKLLDLGAEVHAASAYGDLVVAESVAYNGHTGEQVYSLPFSSRVMAFSGDQSKLVLFNAEDATLGTVDTSVIMPLSPPRMIPEPADGTGQGANLFELAWTESVGALSYEVYLGADSNAVASATTNSLEYLGAYGSPNCPLPAGSLSPGQVYYWRVDSIGVDGTVQPGSVWSFHTATLAADTYSVSLVGVVADYTQTVSVAVDSAVGSPVSWSASSADGMIVLDQTTGTTPSDLVFGVDMSGLTAGKHVAHVTVSDGAISFDVEVTVNLEEMNIVKMETDWQRPYIYLVHTSADYDKHSMLIRYNADMGAIERVLDAGVNATDLAVHYGDDRVYVNNWRHEETRVFDRTGMRELEPLLLGTDVYAINAGRPGRIYVEEEDQWIKVHAHDTTTGALISSVGEREGDGACSRDGRFYYHSDYSSGNAMLSRYEITADAFVDQIAVSSRGYNRERKVFVAGNGEYIYNSGAVYDHDLNELLYLASQIHAASTYGDLVVTEDQVFDGSTGSLLYALPHTASVMAFSGDDSALLLFNAEERSLTRLAVDQIAILPDHEFVPDPADGSLQTVNLDHVAWSTVPSATAYKVYLSTDSNAVATATTNSSAYLGQTAVSALPVPDGLLAGDQTYYWRVDMIAEGQAPEQGPVWYFNTASFVPDRRELMLHGVVASYTQNVSVVVDSAVSMPVDWSAHSTNDWIRLITSTGTAPGSLELGINMSGLGAGLHEGEIMITGGADTLAIPVSLTVAEMNVFKMETDWERPYVYLLHTTPATTSYEPLTPAQSLLIWYNTEAASIEHVQAVGSAASDLAVHYGDDRIYVGHFGNRKTHAIDRTSKLEREPLMLGSNVQALSAGRKGRIYARSDYAPGLTAWSTSNSVPLASVYVRGGGGECSPDGRYYYHAENYYYSGAYMYKFDLSGDTFVEVTSIPKNIRNNTNLLVSRDGRWIYNYHSGYDADLNELLDIGAGIHAASEHGELVVAGLRVYNGISGDEVYALPSNTSLVALFGDQSGLLLYSSADHALMSIDMSEIMPNPDMAADPIPANGSAVNAALPEIAWTPLAEAVAYDVYLGTDSNAVASAEPGDPEYLGREDFAVGTVPDGWLAGATTYYWRVDTVGIGGDAVPGPVWHFDVASIAVDPHALNIDGLQASYTQRVSLAVNSAVSGEVSWSASCSNDWVVLTQTNGTTPATINIGIDMTGLEDGDYTARIGFRDGHVTFEVPVSLSVQPMRINKMATDWTKPYIYMLHDDPSVYRPKTSRLIWYNTDTHHIEQVLPVGNNATDLTVHYGEDRIYVNNEHYPETRVFDRTSMKELEPLVLESDISHINAGRTGRIYTQPDNTGLSAWDTSAQTAVTNVALLVGDGECTVDGRFYYHIDNRSGAAIRKYDLAADAFTQLESVPANRYSGSQNLLLGLDGNRVFNCGAIYDGDLNQLLVIGSEIYAASAYGNLVVTETKAYDGATGEEVYTLPFSVTRMAFSSDQSSLVLFNAYEQILTNLNTSAIMALPTPTLPVVLSAEYAAWQSTYFPNGAIAADADADFDGHSNLDEYIAGTDPASADSYFAMYDAYSLPDGRMVIYWDSMPGRVYSIYWTPSLTDPFERLEADLTYPQNSYTDRVERVGQSGFYQVGVELE